MFLIIYQQAHEKVKAYMKQFVYQEKRVYSRNTAYYVDIISRPSA